MTLTPFPPPNHQASTHPVCFSLPPTKPSRPRPSNTKVTQPHQTGRTHRSLSHHDPPNPAAGNALEGPWHFSKTPRKSQEDENTTLGNRTPVSMPALQPLVPFRSEIFRILFLHREASSWIDLQREEDGGKGMLDFQSIPSRRVKSPRTCICFSPRRRKKLKTSHRTHTAAAVMTNRDRPSTGLAAVVSTL